MAGGTVIAVTIGVALGAMVALLALFASARQDSRADYAAHRSNCADRSAHEPSRTKEHQTHNLNFGFVDTSRKCTICVNDIETDLIHLDCGHAFHRNCIQVWLKMNNTCPNCKHVQKTQI